jgi:membrane-associated PAP2 superfamily phosphatase
VTTAVTRPSAARRDLWVTLAALLALGCWDLAGLDLAAVRLFGSPQGFALRDSWWTATLLHEGGRLAAWATLAAVGLALWQRRSAGAGSR